MLKNFEVVWSDSVNIPDSGIDAHTYQVLYETPTTYDPYRSLCLAVLEAALYDLRNVQRKGQRDKVKNILDWIESEDTEWVFSFVSICETLDLRPGKIRRHLLQVKGVK